MSAGPSNAGIYASFRALVFAAVCAGVLAGLLLGAIHVIMVSPMIMQAEQYEEAGGHTHTGINMPTPPPAISSTPPAAISSTPPTAMRHALTFVADSLAGIGCALLLCAGLVLRGGRLSFGTGLAWGVGGFAAFSLAPALGLPPELPGMVAAALPARQIWWLATVGATAGGLALLAFGHRLPLALAGLALIVTPHILGAPQPPAHAAAVPASLIQTFVMATMGGNLVFWLVLGLACVTFLRRFRSA